MTQSPVCVETRLGLFGSSHIHVWYGKICQEHAGLVWKAVSGVCRFEMESHVRKNDTHVLCRSHCECWLSSEVLRYAYRPGTPEQVHVCGTCQDMRFRQRKQLTQRMSLWLVCLLSPLLPAFGLSLALGPARSCLWISHYSIKLAQVNLVTLVSDKHLEDH